jgi:hypothetical protein
MSHLQLDGLKMESTTESRRTNPKYQTTDLGICLRYHLRMAAKASSTKSTKRADRRAMSNEHKDALAAGRRQSRAVRDYLEALEAHKPKRGRKRTAESVTARLEAVSAQIASADPLNRLLLLQEQRDLQSELETMSDGFDISELEAEFIEVAAAYGEVKGISYAVWREIGVSAAVLRSAGISR